MNPYAMLRIGQCYLETGDENKAKEYLLRAYVSEGQKFFKGDNPKYLEFLNSNVYLGK